MSNAVTVARPTVITVVDYQKTQLKDISLDIRDYSVEGLLGLFNISFHDVNALNEEAMKRANKIRLMMHPDKSRLHEKYFLFFTEAYGRLKEIYEYINKGSGESREKQYAARQYAQVEGTGGSGGQLQARDRDDVGADLENYSAELHELMKRTMHNGGKLDTQKFNESFEKYRGEDPNARGYGDWLKSDQDMIDMGGKVTRGNMAAMFEEQRKKQQSLIVYTGVTDLYANGSYGTSLNDDDTQNFTFHGAEGGTKGPGGAGAPSLQFTDLRQAHTETLIPVTQEDYERMPKFRNLNEYKSHRDSVKFDHGTDAVNKQRLRDQQTRSEQEAMALAFKHAQQLDKARNNERNFLAELKRITGY